MNDADLAAARQGDRTAFARLYEEHYLDVYRFSAFFSGSAHEAEDIAADAFAKALAAVGRFRGAAGQFRPWVLRIARNVAVDRARRERRTTSLDGLDRQGTLPAAAASDPSTGADRADLAVALRALTADQRAVVLLRFVTGLTTRETAATLGKTEGAVESLQHRALAMMAVELAGR